MVDGDIPLPARRAVRMKVEIAARAAAIRDWQKEAPLVEGVTPLAPGRFAIERAVGRKRRELKLRST